MAKKAKKYSKKKAEPNQPGPGFRTRRDHKVKKSIYSGGGSKFSKKNPQVKFNPSTFKIQHKG